MKDENTSIEPLKPSRMSLEGQSVAAILIACLGLLYDLFISGGNGGSDLSAALQQAVSSTDIAAAYKSSSLQELTSVGKTGIIFVFMYKLYTRFLDKRTELKKAYIK